MSCNQGCNIFFMICYLFVVLIYSHPVCNKEVLTGVFISAMKSPLINTKSVGLKTIIIVSAKSR